MTSIEMFLQGKVGDNIERLLEPGSPLVCVTEIIDKYRILYKEHDDVLQNRLIYMNTSNKYWGSYSIVSAAPIIHKALKINPESVILDTSSVLLQQEAKPLKSISKYLIDKKIPFYAIQAEGNLARLLIGFNPEKDIIVKKV